MKKASLLAFILFILAMEMSCSNSKTKQNNADAQSISASEILGNPKYQAISYGGYRKTSRDIQPSLDELKEDMRILYAMGIRVIRTYNVHLPHAANVLAAIAELKEEDASFEMYVMLGAWIDCKNAWSGLPPDHNRESERNAVEIAESVKLAQQYPDIVKVIAVGNESMVKWAAAYYVQPGVILKWVNHLQELKQKGDLPSNLWITSSDNFASWGGGSAEYHVEDLTKLFKAVDYVSMHTYPMHDTHYNPDFWGVLKVEQDLKDQAQIEKAMTRALNYAAAQYFAVKEYMFKIGVDKPVHIGETGWASEANELYGPEGSKATDEFKQGLYYQMMRDWSDRNKISCFFFEAFDEPWKDGNNPGGSENHFGLFTLNGQAKYAIWDVLDTGAFGGLKRGGNSIEKTNNGDISIVVGNSAVPDVKEEITF